MFESHSVTASCIFTFPAVILVVEKKHLPRPWLDGRFSDHPRPVGAVEYVQHLARGEGRHAVLVWHRAPGS